MTLRASLPRIAVGTLLTLTIAVVAAGCGSKSGADNNASGDTGTGQIGEAPGGGQGPAPTPIATPPVEEEPPAPEPTVGPVGPSIILTLNPGLIVPWPSSPDCVSYDPTTASIKYTASLTLWQIVTSNSTPLAFKRQVDAEAGLALVKAYKKHCFIGRGNTRPDRARYIMDYWLEPVQNSPAITSPDCLPHTPSQLLATDAGSLGWRVEGGSESIALFDTKADADNAILVMKHYNRHCYIGRGYTGADRLNYISNWFATV
jgi:hypothetical protein